MKKLCFIFVFLSIQNLHSQNYTPFLIAKGSWLNDEFTCDQAGPQSYSNFLKNWTGQDTSINGVGYTSLFSEWSSAVSPGCGTFSNFWLFSYHGIKQIGYLRQDTIHKKVFFLNKDSTTEYLLYDFTLSLGDTVYSPELNEYGARVEYIDSLLLAGHYYRRLTFFTYDTSSLEWVGSIFWVEGFGSSAGLLSPFFDTQGYQGKQLLCFSNDGQPIFNWLQIPGCTITDIVMNDAHQTAASLSPNPATSFFTLQLSSSPITETQLLLYDALGREVKREQIVSATTTLQRNQLPAGIYYWQLQSGSAPAGRGKIVLE